MMNEPPSGKDDKKPRRPHPLEAPPPRKPDPQNDPEGGNQRVTLRMPVVTPYAVWVLVGINALVYVIVQFFMNDLQQVQLYRDLWNNGRAVLENGEYHRLLTSMFLHSLGTPLHIVFNMFALYVIGITVERFFGHARFLLIYFLGGLSGSIMSVLLSGAGVNSVGASGAVFGIFGAEMVFLYNHRKLFGEMARVQLRQLIIIALLNLGIGLFSTLGEGGGSIDNWAHIGGFIGGTVVAWMIGPIFLPRQHPNQPDALTIDDINPLSRHTQGLLAVVSVLLILLIIGTFLARGGF